MKKMILTVVAVLSMTTAFAGNDPIEGNDMNIYELNVNMNKLSETLKLTDGQQFEVEGIMDTFAKELKEAGEADETFRQEKVNMAIKKDIQKMRRVLNSKQMRTYLRVLNMTVYNRGLNK